MCFVAKAKKFYVFGYLNVFRCLCSEMAKNSIQSCSSPASREGKTTLCCCSSQPSQLGRKNSTFEVAAQLAGRKNATFNSELQPSQLGGKKTPHSTSHCSPASLEGKTPLCHTELSSVLLQHSSSGLSGKIEVELNSTVLGWAKQSRRKENSLC